MAPTSPAPSAAGGGIRRLREAIINVLTYVILAIANVVMKVVEILFNIIRRINSRFVKFTKSLQNRLGARFSASSRNKVGMMVVYAGLTRNPEEILGIVLIYSIMLAAATLFIVGAIGEAPFAGFKLPYGLIILAAIVLPFIAIWMLFYIIFLVLIDRRTNSIEKVLPDVLTMISQNMIAGMTVYNSLWVAARPEFGPLAFEIQSVARDTLGGESFEKSLMGMSSRIKSYKLARAVKLMIQGMRSGGELPTVLQEIANDIRAEQNLFKRMSSETTSQAMFILFALLVGAPLLFSASNQFIVIFTDIYHKIGLDEDLSSMPTQGSMISIKELPIKSDFFMFYAGTTLTVSSAFGALLIGLIRTGKLSSGIPLVPVVALCSVLIFLGLQSVLSSFFAGMMV